MNDEMLGISALDPRVAATDKFIKDKNIPPDQVPAFILSLGYDPKLAGLVMRFRKLKQAAESQKNAQGAQTTAGQDINAAYNNMKQQEVAQKVEDATRARQRMAGIPTIPAPTMDRATFNAAAGGLVAFAGGGAPVSSYEDVTQDSYLTPDEAKEFEGLLALQRNIGMSPYADPGSRTLWERSKPRYEELLLKRQGAQQRESFEKRSAATEAAARAEAERRGLPYVAPSGVAAPTPSAAGAVPYSDIGATYGGPRGRGGKESRKPSDFQVERPEAKEEKFTATKIPAAGSVKAEKVGDLASFEQQLADIAKARGWGAARKEYGEYLKQQQEEAKKQGGVDRSLALAQAGFSAMQAAAQPGGTFGGAFGAFGTKYAADLMALNRQQKMLDREMRESQYKLSQADELEAQGRLRDAMALRKDEQARAERIAMHREEMGMQGARLQSEERRFTVQQANARALAEARTAATTRDAMARLQVARVNALKNLNADIEYQDAVRAMEVAKKSKSKADYDAAKAKAESRRDEYLGDLEEVIKNQGASRDRFSDLMGE